MLQQNKIISCFKEAKQRTKQNRFNAITLGLLALAGLLVNCYLLTNLLITK